MLRPSLPNMKTLDDHSPPGDGPKRCRARFLDALLYAGTGAIH